MKNKLLGIIAVGLLAGPLPADAVVISVGGANYDVTYTSGTANSLLSVLDDQVWFGNPALAEQFASTLGAGLGFPNNGGARGPHFLAVTDGSIYGGGPFEGYRALSTGGILGFSVDGSSPWAWATATRVPEPGTLALLGLGLAALGFARRRKLN